VRRTIVFVTHSLTEAVYLGRRIAVFTARPGRIKLDIANDLPRPRAIGAAEFNRMVDLVWQQLKAESLAAAGSGKQAARENILLPKE
jgi:NitT/TauT family transport system ATP-binding protein